MLAAAALALSYFELADVSWPYYALLIFFLTYSIVVAIRALPQAGMLGLLALFGDTVFFLIIASRGPVNMTWLASFFFLHVLTEALAFYGTVELVIITGVSVVFCGLLPYPELRQLEPIVLIAGVLACGCAVNKRKMLNQIGRLTEEIQETRNAAEKAREDERQRIASDFHDGPLQSFISLQMRLEILRKLLDRDSNAGMEDLRQLQALAVQQIRDLRAFLHSMRPADVDAANLGAHFIANARRAAESFQKESGIPVTFIASNTSVGLNDEVTLEVLQMIREALHNVQKHVGATRVAVAMERTDQGLEISIDDNGHGFNFAGTYSLEELELLRLGPASLKRRARSINADLQLESRPGRGVGLKVRIPLEEAVKRGSLLA